MREQEVARKQDENEMGGYSIAASDDPIGLRPSDVHLRHETNN